MKETILIGRGQTIVEIPYTTWKQHLIHVPQHSQSRLSFMTKAHEQIRYFVVKEILNTQKPITPEYISEGLIMPLESVNSILEELERNLFFLVRNDQGSVNWAFPVTIEATPHKMVFSSGEHLYAAWAEDAIASPFVQGQLRKEYISVEVESRCKHCDRVIQFTIDSNMHVSIRETGANPLVFMPDVDWNSFAERTIIDPYWRNSVFFWSEEHAREYRASSKQVNGEYLTLEQCAYMTPIVQGALFAFKSDYLNI